MASGYAWDPQHLFHEYLLDYFVKNNMHETAEIFRKETNLHKECTGIDLPQGFLLEWWSLFYDVYTAMQPKHQENTEASSKATIMVGNQQRILHPVVEHSALDQQRLRQFPIRTNSDKMIGQLAASSLAAKVYEERQLRRLMNDLDSSSQFLNANKQNLLNLAASSSSHLQQQIYSQSQQLVMRDDRHDFNLGRTMPMEPSIHGAGRAILPIPGPQGARVNLGVNPVLVNDWPLDAPKHEQKFQKLMLKHQPEHLAQTPSYTPVNLTSKFPGSAADFACQNLMLPKTDLSVKNAQMVVQMRQNAEHQPQHEQLQTELQETGRKMKKLSYSSAADKTLDYKNAEVDKYPVDDFLSYDVNIDSPSTPSRIFKCHSTAQAKDESFTFNEVACLHSSNSKILCCHFSSDGKLLASAGHEKKVSVWSMETFDCIHASNGHSLIITDVRFRPKSTIFATSSFDRTVQIWDASNPSKSLFKLAGHTEQVRSLDFHPRKVDLLCSCDTNDEIRFWNVNQCACTRITKGATKQVRFQPKFGSLLATSAGNNVNVFDVETGKCYFRFRGHAKEVLSICWDRSGTYIASVSEDRTRVWSADSGGCIYELKSSGNKFQSCTFHPRYSQLLIIGGYQSLELWNPSESSKTWRVHAHDGSIASLAASTRSEMVASASHDQCVKLWK